MPVKELQYFCEYKTSEWLVLLLLLLHHFLFFFRCMYYVFTCGKYLDVPDVLSSAYSRHSNKKCSDKYRKKKTKNKKYKSEQDCCCCVCVVLCIVYTYCA